MTAKTCPHCHAPVPADAPGGFCPACLLRGADEAPPAGDEAPSLEEVAAAFPQLEILGLIGRGGMGSVYQARQPGLDRRVALKILSPALGRDPAFEERFAREARALAKLSHPNIVTVFEHGEAGGFFYLLMEYVDGVNLRQAMQAGRFTPEQALALVPGICDALQTAHAQGVWHRDIKPENILLDRAGRVKIADFGIARIAGDSVPHFTLTRTGGLLGSAAYMAPEQHEKPHAVDHRADIYSLGVVIYEMLTGELPLGRFPLPSQRAAVDARIDEIVLRTLEKERELRQQSAEEVKTEVQGAAGIREARPPAVPAIARESAQVPLKTRWWVDASIGALLAGGVAAGIAGFIAESYHYSQVITAAMMVVMTLGASLAVMGYLGTLVAMARMRRGIPGAGRQVPLVAMVLVPTLIAIPTMAALTWFSISKNPSASATGFATALYAVLTMGIPVLAGGLMWRFFGLPLRPGRRTWRIPRIVLATTVALAAVVLAQYVVTREAQYRSYKSRTILFLGRVSLPRDQSLLSAALDRALGEWRPHFRVRVFGPDDPFKPAGSTAEVGSFATLEWTSPVPADVDKGLRLIEPRLHASLPKSKAITAAFNAGGATSSMDENAPAAWRDDYRRVRSLNVILLIAPVLVVLLVASAGGWAASVAPLAAVVCACAMAGTSWPRPPDGFPPPFTGSGALAPLADREYDFSTPADVVDSMLKAAKKGDVEAFKRGISRSLLELMAGEDASFAAPMKNWARCGRGGDAEFGQDYADFRLRNNLNGNFSSLHLIREEGGWKVNKASGGGFDELPSETGEASGLAPLEISLEGADLIRVAGEACPPEELAGRLRKLAGSGRKKAVIRAGDTAPYSQVVRVMNACSEAGLMDVQFASATISPARKAMEELLRAARDGDGPAFAAVLGADVIREITATGEDPARSYGDFSKVKRVEEGAATATTADFVLEADDGSGRRFTFRMVLEDGKWKLSSHGH